MSDEPLPNEIMEAITEVEQEAHDFDPNDLPESQQQLVDDLSSAGAPSWMIEKTREGWYHDYVSEHPMPKALLVHDAQETGLQEIADRAKRGDYDP